MAYGKWIGGFLGFINAQSVLGAIAGFVLGAIFDAITEHQEAKKTSRIMEDGEQETTSDEGTRNGFLFCLMVLTAHVIQADGRIMHSEMELVRKFLRNSFGEIAMEQGNDILRKLFEYKKQKGDALWNQQIRSACEEMADAMPEEHRIQVVAFLAEIAKTDGNVHDAEIAAIRTIAVYLLLDAGIVEQLFALGTDSLEESYKVLGVSPDVSDDDLKQAYWKLVLKHHPDRVANLGDDIKEAATRKLQEINKAKEIIDKARNLK